MLKYHRKSKLIKRNNQYFFFLEKCQIFVNFDAYPRLLHTTKNALKNLCTMAHNASNIILNLCMTNTLQKEYFHQLDYCKHCKLFFIVKVLLLTLTSPVTITLTHMKQKPARST